ncbi:hypothetical protein EON66_04780 [archaeon]|nr:MAG: hypothetical protein EON66_04780 [archaeon]
MQDDFYITPQLAVMETTNSVFNQTLFQLYLTPKSALSWQRAYIANGFATSATEWTDLFAMYNSGTYNNQVRLRAMLWLPRGRHARMHAHTLRLLSCTLPCAPLCSGWWLTTQSLRPATSRSPTFCASLSRFLASRTRPM